MTKKQKYDLTELSDAVAPARQRHHELIDAACTWQAGRQRQTDPDLFALICAAADDPVRWTRIEVASFARCGIPHWCSTHRCLWPEGHLESLWEWFTFLHETGRMDPSSDPVGELHKPLACYGPLDQHGRRLPLGAGRQIECECALPYRETALLLGELVLRCERSGDDPLHVLRRLITDPAPRWDPSMFGDDGDWLDGYGSVGLLD